MNSIYTIAITGVNKDGTVPSYGERCPGIMAVTYSYQSFGSGSDPVVCAVFAFQIIIIIIIIVLVLVLLITLKLIIIMMMIMTTIYMIIRLFVCLSVMLFPKPPRQTSGISPHEAKCHGRQRSKKQEELS